MTGKTISKEDVLRDYWGYVQQTVNNFGDKEFIITQSGSLTYNEVNQRANVICASIKQQTKQVQCGVGLFVKDHLKIIPAMIGVLKSGNYMIPLDVSFPEETLKGMFESANIQLFLTCEEHKERLQTIVGNSLPVIDLDDLNYEQIIPDPVVTYKPEDFFQIMFTSGSTGRPKGAIEDYRYLVRAAYHNLLAKEEALNNRTMQLSTFTFSAPHTMLFAALINGNTICYYNLKDSGITGLPDWIREQKITHYTSTPTVFRSLVSILKPGDMFMSIHTFQLGAERKLRQDIQAIRKHFPNVTHVRLSFASTETQRVTVAEYPIDGDFTTTELPSGWPYDDIEVFIWDENGKSLPQGKEGEIVVHGDALARGYINNPQLTAERFLPDEDNPGWQFFKTGDLGMLLPDGQLVHLGRIDNMVKIKGVRIELEAIEHHILEYPGIIQVASRAFEDDKGNKRLASYFVPEPGIHIPISDLRKHLSSCLPRHLLPHFLVELPELPLTTSGKVARQQLPIPSIARPDLQTSFTPPSTDLERQLAKIWEQEIGLSGIGIDDDFFDLGGDSLIGVLLFARIEQELGRDIPVSILLTANTIRKQARLILSDDNSAPFSILTPVRPTGNRPPLFFIPGKGGYPTRIRHLAKNLDPSIPVYALQDLSQPGNNRAARSIETSASLYLNEIHKISPHGPYLLVGESLGGKIAFEMAQQLRKIGEPEPLLFLLDTYNMSKDPESGPFSIINRSSYYWMLLKKHITILVKSDWQGKKDYLLVYRKDFLDKLKRISDNRNHRRRAKKTNRGSLPKKVRELERVNLEASASYEVKSYPGTVILIKATRGLRTENPSNGWDQVELGKLVIHPLDCYHGSILFEPAVSQLAWMIQSYINNHTEI